MGGHDRGEGVVFDISPLVMRPMPVSRAEGKRTTHGGPAQPSGLWWRTRSARDAEKSYLGRIYLLLATSTNGTVWDPRDQGWGRAWVNCLRVRL